MDLIVLLCGIVFGIALLWFYAEYRAIKSDKSKERMRGLSYNWERELIKRTKKL